MGSLFQFREAAMLLCALAVVVAADQAAQIDVWPYPLPQDSFEFSIESNVDSSDHDLLGKAFDRYYPLVFSPAPTKQDFVYRQNIFANRINGSNPTRRSDLEEKAVVLPGLKLVIEKSPVALVHGVNESYVLTVPASGEHATLAAPSVWGALKGLETFSQLVKWSKSPAEGYYFYDAPLQIVDEPRFPWRGLLIDTSRHFLSVATVKHAIDVMSYNKLNVLHWHFSDAESYSIESKKYANFTEFAAYSPSAVYSHDDVKAIVEHARLRGVRVMAELDTPGHIASWGQAYPQLVADCYAWIKETHQGRLEWPSWDSVAMDVTHPFAREFTTGLLSELFPLFPDASFHIGGDEVSTGCWNHSEPLKAWMRANEYAKFDEGYWKYDFYGLQKMWMTYMQKQVKDLSKGARRSIVWEEAYELKFDLLDDTIVHVWQDAECMVAAINDGHPVINSMGWYVDRQAPTCKGSVCEVNWMWMWTWRDMYRVEPYSGFPAPGPTDAQKKLLLGGEAASWAESVDDLNFDERVWSRGPAISERLWSPMELTDPQLAQARFSSFQCKMARRGVIAAPSQPSWCDVPEIHYGPEEQEREKWSGVAYGLGVLAVVLLIANAIQCCFYRRLQNSQQTSGQFERI